jgi:ABC-2 type transport system ATP-binding protein
MAIIETSHLRKEFWRQEKAPGLLASLRGLYKKQGEALAAVKDLNLSVDSGETVAFIGPNGAGKSTTIKMLTGILYPTSGEARVLGLTPWESRTKLAFHIGTVFGQKSQLWYHLPPSDSFLLLGRIYELDDDVLKRRTAELADWFDIKDFFNVPVRKLSLGQRMRCELAAALLHQPEVVFLDEPTIGLDVVARKKMRELIRNLNKDTGVTVFLTSHDTGDIEDLCRRVIMINNGELVIDQPVATLRREYLHQKTIRVRMEQPVDADPVIEGVKVLKHKGAGLKLSLDTSVMSIDDLYMALRQIAPIADITIDDPALEEIIASIYGGSGKTPPPAEVTPDEEDT